ncbi:hypothetical protein B0T22DRAFT_481140 [Podospora appendiculata]|uniref:DUF4105 domain-containing protein n=1 Tax=Podospora appendiculata TaxID=314037 RepID=A0AAE1CDP9_9PEZI|nr:hypothetical protein B0T22DRAFT_481140 [Podospora appendiculata]
MKLNVLSLVFASLAVFASGQDVAERAHPRDFSVAESGLALPSIHETIVLERDATAIATNPVIPAGKDATKLHVWTRLDTRPKTYVVEGVNHDGLNQLMLDIGGRHMDVIVGNPTKGYIAVGLEFSDKDWLNKDNGDGFPVESYSITKDTITGETFTYQGQVADGRSTLNSIGKKAADLIKGKTYNHQTYNCKTFANLLVSKLI